MTTPTPAAEPDETLVGTTTRPVHFHRCDHKTREVLEIRLMPPGTEVYAHVRRGKLQLRVPGTLLTATVGADAVQPA
jgi:hypothetical protein